MFFFYWSVVSYRHNKKKYLTSLTLINHTIILEKYSRLFSSQSSKLDCLNLMYACLIKSIYEYFRFLYWWKTHVCWPNYNKKELVNLNQLIRLPFYSFHKTWESATTCNLQRFLYLAPFFYRFHPCVLIRQSVSVFSSVEKL